MRRSASVLVLCLLALPAFADDAPVIRLVEFEATVNPITAMRITRAIEDAEVEGDALVLIELDTPGGLVDSMEQIVKAMLNAEVPVVVWVGPAGAHAASAGFFILMAADVAAMAPGTRTGAAATVTMGGENREGDVLLKKSNEDLAALIRSIAERRGRNVEACERAVFDAKAYEEQLALEEGLIDLVARDRDELLRLLDSREVLRFDETTVVLHTADARFVTSKFPWRQKFMEALSHPILVYLLLLGGMAGIYAEFTHPGAVFPGVVGAMCLLLFALSSRVLPLSATGILLIILAMVMFVLEVKVTSFGLLTLGGVACLVIGSLVLIKGPIPEMRVPARVVIPASLVLAAACAVAVRLAYRAHREKVGTGKEGLVGEMGRVTRDLDPRGKVFVHGEIWSGVSTGGTIPEGTPVRVVGVERMRLTVEPAEDEADRS